MTVVDFSQDDILRGKLLTPGWYRVVIGLYSEANAKSRESTNWKFEDTRVIKNAENGSEEFTGVPLTLLFNSKAKGFLVGFLSALGAEIKAGSRFNLENASGKEVEVFVENDTYEGRMVNRINHKYRTAAV